MVAAHPYNVPGDFYVKDGCCQVCGVPQAIAPRLFAFDSEMHCYVRRQPADAAELAAMIEAMDAHDVGCVRYRGQDARVLTRLAENDGAALCDIAPAPGAQPIVRDHVVFRLASAATSDRAIGVALKDFRHYLRRQGRPPARWRVSAHLWQPAVRFAWVERQFHSVRLAAVDDRPGYLLARHGSEWLPGGRAVSRIVHAWLTTLGAADIRWFTTEQWQSGEPGTEWPT
jgi:hypothetical protein